MTRTIAILAALSMVAAGPRRVPEPPTPDAWADVLTDQEAEAAAYLVIYLLIIVALIAVEAEETAAKEPSDE